MTKRFQISSCPLRAAAGVIVVLTAVLGVVACRSPQPGPGTESGGEDAVNEFPEVLTMAQAKDTLLGVVFRDRDNFVTGFYTGFQRRFDPDADPSQEGCDGDGDGNPSTCNGPLNMNTEHVWPRSLGADGGPAESDLFILVPTRSDVNQARGNRPFGVVREEDADRWFRGGETLETPPPDSLRGQFSAVDFESDVFEPRDAVKGDVARALFYFVHTYGSLLDAEGQTFFRSQLPMLLDWHARDLPDSAEVSRARLIATYQGGAVNPFIEEPELVGETFGLQHH